MWGQILDAPDRRCNNPRRLSPISLIWGSLLVKHLLLAFVLVAAAVGSGCGPIQSTSYLLDAEVAIQSAKTAGADKYAPYEYTSATLYIHKAREEVGYSDFEVAVNFAQKASRYANEAREKAMSLAKDAPPPPPLPPSVP